MAEQNEDGAKYLRDRNNLESSPEQDCGIRGDINSSRSCIKTLVGEARPDYKYSQRLVIT